MPIKQLSLPCARCDAVMPHNQDVPNHVAHGLATLFTGGWWGLAWFGKSVKKRDTASCTKCGNVRNVSGPATIYVPPAVAPPPDLSLNKAQIAIIIVMVAAVVGFVIYEATTG